MAMTLKQADLGVSDDDLKKAISIRFDRHFPAMNIARAFGGCGSSIPWTILEQYIPQQLLDEAAERGIDLSELEVSMNTCDCCPRLVVESGLFQRLQEGKKDEEKE